MKTKLKESDGKTNIVNYRVTLRKMLQNSKSEQLLCFLIY